MIINNYRGVSLDKEGMLRAVISQLNKDILLSGFTFSFNLNLSLELFYKELFDWLNLIFLEEKTQFITLLYRVDIQEKRVFNDSIISIDNIVILILEREFQKVVLKEYFKG